MQRTAVAAIYSALTRQSVLTRAELEAIAFKELASTVITEDFVKVLNKFTTQVGDKFYLKGSEPAAEN